MNDTGIMKRILYLVILAAFLAGCIKIVFEGRMIPNGVTPGGCATSEETENVEMPVVAIDTVIFSLSGDTLRVTAGFNENCCFQFKTRTEIKNNTVTMRIMTTKKVYCDCICYYSYSFDFLYPDLTYSYVVKIDKRELYSGPPLF